MKMPRLLRWQTAALFAVLLAAGLAGTVYANHGECDLDSYVFCGSNNFAHTYVESDGDYEVDWSEWDDDNPNNTYTVVRNRILYRADLKYKNTGPGITGDTSGVSGNLERGNVSAGDPVLEAQRDLLMEPGSCAPAADRWNSDGTPTRFRWECTSVRVNLQQTPTYGSTSPQTLASNSNQTSLTGSLSAPGRKQDVEFTALLKPEGRPTSADQQLTTAQRNDTVQLTADEIEMHLFYITARVNNSSSMHVASVDGENGFQGGL